MKQLAIFLSLAILAFGAKANKMPVEGQGTLKAGELVFIGELSETVCPTDNNGKHCAHIVVEIPLSEVGFESDMIMKQAGGNGIEVTPGQYSFWVSTSGNTTKKSISIAHSRFYSTTFPLSCNGKKLMPQGEYKIKINTPSRAGTVIFISEYTNNYSLYIDGDLFEPADNGMVSVNLPAGTYSYVVQSAGRDEITESITFVSDSIIEKQLSIFPTNKHSEEYVKYRFLELYKNKRERISYTTPKLKEFYTQCCSIRKEFPSLLEGSRFLWFLNDAERKNSKLTIEGVRLNGSDEAALNIKFSFPQNHDWTLIMRFISNDWYLDEIQNEDKNIVEWGGTYEKTQLLSAQSAFQYTIEAYNHYKRTENEPSEFVQNALRSILALASIDEEYELGSLQDFLTLKGFNMIEEPYDLYWTYNCQTEKIRGHVVAKEYGKESMFINGGNYRIAPWFIITVWKEGNIKFLNSYLQQHGWQKRGDNWFHEDNKFLTIEQNSIYGTDAYTIYFTQYTEDSLEYMKY